MLRKKNLFIIVISTLLSHTLYAQIGGESTYQFLSLPFSARTSALAGSSSSVYDNDLTLALSNPSLLDSSMHQHISINYADYLKDINYGTAAYAYHSAKLGTFALALNYFNYGEFTEADETSQKLGTFTSSDYAFNLLYARPISNQIQVGASMKVLYSDYYLYSSSGIAFDLAATYHKDQTGFSSSLLISNLGFQFKPYRESNYESLPLDVQLGVSQRLKYAPFRVMLQMHHLHNWNLAYDSPLKDNTGVLGQKDKEEEKPNAFTQSLDELIRHINVGVEFIPVKNIYLRAGFNFQRYKELAVSSKFGMVGFGLGAGIRIYKFHISYSHAFYHVSGATNTFSVSSNLNEFF